MTTHQVTLTASLKEYKTKIDAYYFVRNINHIITSALPFLLSMLIFVNIIHGYVAAIIGGLTLGLMLFLILLAVIGLRPSKQINEIKNSGLLETVQNKLRAEGYTSATITSEQWGQPIELEVQYETINGRKHVTVNIDENYNMSIRDGENHE